MLIIYLSFLYFKYTYELYSISVLGSTSFQPSRLTPTALNTVVYP